MNFKNHFKTMDAKKWKAFALDFLVDTGFHEYIATLEAKEDQDVFLLEKHGIVFYVSTRNNATEGKSVGTEIEKNILERMKSNNATGFIGFYSGNFSTSLLERLNKLAKNSTANFTFKLFNGHAISLIMPLIHSHVYNDHFNNGNPYSLNIPAQHYEELECCCGQCGIDILHDDLIVWSMAQLTIIENEIYFIFGHKLHLTNFPETRCGWLEISQCLHLEQILMWNAQIDRFISDSGLPLSEKFYHERNRFNTAITQKLRSSNAGMFLRLN